MLTAIERCSHTHLTSFNPHLLKRRAPPGHRQAAPMTGVASPSRGPVPMDGKQSGAQVSTRDSGKVWRPERDAGTRPKGTPSGSPSGSSPLDSPGQARGVRKHQHKHSVKSRYEMLESLGRGTYGKVKKAVEKGTGRMVAVKSIGKEKITDELDKVHLQREIEITALLKHDHIIQVYEVFENKDKIIIIMEYASNGELYDYVNNQHLISENEARGFFRQIVNAVHYCHKKGIVHRDLKLENILLDENLQVKLADFGLSTIYKRNQVLDTFCGSTLYASPEIVNGVPYQGPEVDCWALGVLLYAMVYGIMPFDDNNYKTLSEQISLGEYRKPPHLSGACGLIDWMLTVNVNYRATIEDIANHWWVNWGFDTVVCDCDSAQECQSPLLARYIDCQYSLGFEERTFGGEEKTHVESGLRPAETKENEAGLRKSKKENDIKHSQQDTVSKATSKKPKGILKKRSSFDSGFFSSSSFSENLAPSSEAEGQGKPAPAAANNMVSKDSAGASGRDSVMSLPRKGILKKHYERESGYSSSPERGVSSVCQPIRDLSKENPPRSEKGQQRRKGILKRNGRFSTSLDLPIDCSALKLSDSLRDLILCNGRPSSIISDDSFLSSDSFDLLDMTADTKRELFTHTDHAAVYISASEDEEPTDLPRHHAKLKCAKTNHDFHSPCFSQKEHSVGTIYTQAKNICDCMNEQ